MYMLRKVEGCIIHRRSLKALVLADSRLEALTQHLFLKYALWDASGRKAGISFPSPKSTSLSNYFKAPSCLKPVENSKRSGGQIDPGTFMQLLR